MDVNTMSNVCFYTFSTVCQTLAGAFGFLVAVALYRLKEIPDQLKSLLHEAEVGRGLGTNVVGAATLSNTGEGVASP
jgi:hypothetical protein